MLIGLLFVLALVRAQSSQYFLGNQGESCAATCGRQGRECLTSINTNNSTALFKQLGIQCTKTTPVWWAPNQPCYVSGAGDPNYGECLGYTEVPVYVSCQATYWSVRRVCNCGNDISSSMLFGTGLSGGSITTNETVIFAHTVSAGNYGVMTHYWSTAGPGVLENAIVRYYVDGETTASIAFAPPMAAGIGFGDSSAPRGTKWIGIGAGNPGNGEAYYVNILIPFGSSIVVTVQHLTGNFDGFYMIVRGMLNKPLSIEGVVLPVTARLQLQVFQGELQPLEYLAVTNVPTGNGYHFLTFLSAQSGNLNFLEGCFHTYSPYNQSYPGTLMSTGTEDYFDSGWYFNAGQFYFPVSGFTHLDQTNGVTWSAYRFHEMDPLMFSGGFKLVWRNGDAIDPATGLKCFTETGGIIAGSPTASNVTSYSWVYTW